MMTEDYAELVKRLEPGACSNVEDAFVRQEAARAIEALVNRNKELETGLSNAASYLRLASQENVAPQLIALWANFTDQRLGRTEE